MEQIFVYRTSGGKNILSNLSNEVKPIVLTVLEGILKDGLENLLRDRLIKRLRQHFTKLRRKMCVYFITGVWIIL